VFDRADFEHEVSPGRALALLPALPVRPVAQLRQQAHLAVMGTCRSLTPLGAPSRLVGMAATRLLRFGVAAPALAGPPLSRSLGRIPRAKALQFCH